jgi:uncharacterized lipoprotein YddW (UPF0748 family)
MKRIALIGLTMLLIPVAALAEDLVIDDFSYPSDAAAQQAWRAIEGPPATLQDGPSPADGRALRLTCPFTGDLERVYCDREVTLDLSRFGRFTFDLYVGNPGVCGRMTVYFRSGAGWYGAGVNGEAGWQKVTLMKSQFRSEDTPAGWGAIDGIRLSPWKGADGDSYVALDNLGAHSSDIAVVRSTRSAAEAPDEARSVEQFSGGMQELLARAGISSDLVTDEDVVAGALKTRKVALFPHSPRMAPEVVQAAREFVAAGGKVFAFYSLDPAMAETIGVRNVGWKRAEPSDEFAKIAFEAPDIEGLPKTVRQDSWNITRAEPARPDARIIGWWESNGGNRAADPAVILSDSGLYMAHVVTDADSDTKAQMMTALIGHFLPAVWVNRARQAIADAPRVGPFTAVGDLTAYVGSVFAAGARPANLGTLLARGQERLKSAQASLDAGTAPTAAEEATQAHNDLKEAYMLAHKPRAGEFRALWEHSGAGAFPGDWAASIDAIAKAGFNAIVPNMWWAGVAHYDSELLPHSATFDKYGDQIEQCVRAAHARGVEVHPWKVNWNLSTAPQEFVDKMRAEGRLAVTNTGEQIRWLCASNPANYQLELDTMLEVARKYDVDGIHFDYIRYEDDSICYCDGCRERFQKDTGLTVANWPTDCHSGPLHDQYRDWRCDQITRLVRATSEQAHKLKPYLKVSAAVFSDYPSCRTYVGQDWVKWVNEGYLDFICPMDYTDSNGGFRRTVARQIAFVDGQIPLYPGIGASAPGLPADQVIAQAEIARDLGADGFIIFALTPTTVADHVPALGRGLTSQPTFLTQNAPRVSLPLPGQPDPADGAVHLPRQPLSVKAQIVDLGQFRREPREVEAAVELQDTYGTVLGKLGSLKGAAGAQVTVTVPPRDGRLRVVVTGELRFREGKPEPFVVRSTPFVFEVE